MKSKQRMFVNKLSDDDLKRLLDAAALTLASNEALALLCDGDAALRDALYNLSARMVVPDPDRFALLAFLLAKDPVVDDRDE
jgi:hypothetical protein